VFCRRFKAEVEQLGGRIVGAEISEVLLENRQVDPAVLAKSSSRLEKNITWKWEL
jgi:UDP-glucose 4-epimerase